MMTQTKKWSGEVCNKGLVSFFANGFVAKEIQESPGRFTIFMFPPKEQTPTGKSTVWTCRT
jgi:hypothetical protein